LFHFVSNHFAGVLTLVWYREILCTQDEQAQQLMACATACCALQVKQRSCFTKEGKRLRAERCRRQFLGGSRYAAAPPTAHLWMVTGLSRGQGETKSDRATGRREGEGR
ncbi:unnamed protein product, partial [Ectocarpus sp. 8 AP-2014]